MCADHGGKQPNPHTVGIAQVFRQSARLYASRTAVASEDGTALTYGELDALTDAVAVGLLEQGIRTGDRVAVMSSPCPEYVAVNIAGAKLGVTVVGVNTRYTPEEVGYCLDDSAARLFLFDPAFRSVAETATGMRDVVQLDLTEGSGGAVPSLRNLVDAAPSVAIPHEPSADDMHTVIYTSGTTGRPKGAMISQGAAAVRALRLSACFGLGPEDAYLGWSPLFHTGGEEPLNATIMSGGTFLTFRRADPHHLVDAIENRGGTWSWLLPGMMAEFMDAVRHAGASLRGYRFGGGYGNLLPSSLVDDLVSRGPGFMDLFGQTETSLLVASNLVDKPGERQWRKWPAPLMDVRILREDGTEAGVDEPGECVVRGPSIMSGYLNRPETNDEVFAGGWLHTGDVLARAEDGSLRFADRKRYLIKTGGENVFPAEVENVIATHPDVAEVCVVGVPHDTWGETVKAFIVVRPGATIGADEIAEYCRGRMAGFKRPRIVEFIGGDDLPRSVTGKIQRDKLVQRSDRAASSGGAT